MPYAKRLSFLASLLIATAAVAALFSLITRRDASLRATARTQAIESRPRTTSMNSDVTHAVAPSETAWEVDSTYDAVEMRRDKVREALEQFQRRTSHLTQEVVDEGFAKVAKARKSLGATPTPEPIAEAHIEDDDGNRWLLRTYEDGQILYEIANE